MQQLAYVRLAVQASNQIDTPPVNPTYCQNRDIDLPTTTDLSYPQRSSSCIQWLDRPQIPASIIQLHSTTRPTSAFRYVRPAAFYDSTDSYPHQTSSCIFTTQPTPTTLIEHPGASYDSTDLSFPPRSSSCILRLNRQLPASNIQLYLHDSTYATYPHRIFSCAYLWLDHASYRPYPSSWRPNTTATDFTHTFVIPTINYHPCCICYLAFVSFIVFGCHYSHALNLNHLRGRHAYRLRNTCDTAATCDTPRNFSHSDTIYFLS